MELAPSQVPVPAVYNGTAAFAPEPPSFGGWTLTQADRDIANNAYLSPPW